MIHGKIIRYNCSWLFLIKKHYCFHCKELLDKKKREIVVNSSSEEAEKYDFSVGDLYLHGNIKFITFYYECPHCRMIYEISELKRNEKMKT